MLQISDVLICDWSSIAFDYLILNRPTLFLDVEPPFRKGFSLGPEYRFGPVIASLDALLAELAHRLKQTQEQFVSHEARYAVVREQVYEDMRTAARRSAASRASFGRWDSNFLADGCRGHRWRTE